MKHKCPACNGTGRAELPDAANETLDRLKKRKTATAQQLFRKSDYVAMTAINMRLLRLERMGLVTRERRGQFWIYTAK